MWRRECPQPFRWVTLPPEQRTIKSRRIGLPSERPLLHFARRVLPDHVNPFARITIATVQRIDEAFKIRNYLSHQSKASLRSLMRMYKSNYGLKRFKEPGALLLANRYSRLIEYGEAFETASKEMSQIIF